MKELQIILDEHKKWLENIGGSRADLSDADLNNTDLRGADLIRGANLSDANLKGADLSDANLRSANLSDADLSDADLRYADLRCADLSDADLRSADLRYIDLRSANLRGANLSDADLSDADLSDADLRSADLRCADLRYADLSANLRSANLRGADLSDAEGLLSQIDYMFKHFEKTDEGIIVYKTFAEYHVPPEEWDITEGSIITENVNFTRTQTCGCGVNVATLDWAEYSCHEDIWKCLIKYEWLAGVCVPYNTDGKIRAEKVKLLEKI